MSYRWWLFITIFLFGFGLALGLATPAGTISPLSEEVAALEEFAGLLASLPQSSIVLLILAKNVMAILLSFALSPVFNLVPVIALIMNGWLIGLVSTLVLREQSLGYLLSGLVPHGIFELPALIMGEAAALSFGTAVFLALFKGRRENLLPNLKRNLKYLAIALGLFIPAAIIETYVTPLFLG